MAVAPDLLLSSATEVRPKASPKPQTASPEAASGKPSSFAKVLAGERQAEAASARRAEERAHAEKSQSEPQRQINGRAEPSEEPVIAEDGKPLPTEEDAESVLDPLLLLGLGVVTDEAQATAATAEESGEVAVGIQEELSSTVVAALPTSMPLNVDSEALDDDTELSLGLDKKASPQPSSLSALAASVKTAAGDEVAPQSPDEQSEPEFDLEASPGKLTEQLPGATKDSVADSNLEVRLNTLTQAVNQATPAQRVLMPGQPVPMNQSGWSEAIVDRVMLLSSQNLKTAEIQLDPAELGRLDVRVSLSQDQTLVSFSSPHAGVREALESQMYRMRELFAQQGMGQVDVNVSDQSLTRNFEGQRGEKEGADGETAGLAAHDGDELQLDEIGVPQAVTGRGLVDYYA